MILASATCPNCKTYTEAPVEDTALVVRCQECGQMNIITTKEPINGLCKLCNRPIDGSGHVIGKEGLTGCRNQPL